MTIFFFFKIIEGTEDFSIAEIKKGPRTWVLSNVNWTRNLLENSGHNNNKFVAKFGDLVFLGGKV